MWCDNLGAMYLSVNPMLHSRTKYVDLDFYFIRERVAAKTLRVAFVSSKDQLADMLTKPLSPVRFNLLRSALTISPVQLDLRGTIEATGSSALHKSRASTTPTG